MEYLEGESRFYVQRAQGEAIAEMTFHRVGSDIAVIEHKYVNESYRGQGIADQLFDCVVEKMRKEKREIVPLCSFAVKQFELKPQYQDMLAQR